VDDKKLRRITELGNKVLSKIREVQSEERAMEYHRGEVALAKTRRYLRAGELIELRAMLAKEGL
jgi:hypothetical protein